MNRKSTSVWFTMFVINLTKYNYPIKIMLFSYLFLSFFISIIIPYAYYYEFISYIATVVEKQDNLPAMKDF